MRAARDVPSPSSPVSPRGAADDVGRTPVRTPEPRGPIRAGDADRERVVEALRVHAGAGRIDADELERRIEAAYAATHLSDLDAVLAELPPLPRAATRARPWAAAAGPPAGPPGSWRCSQPWPRSSWSRR